MAACPRCGSFLVGGTTCELCSRYSASPPSASQPWQPPAWTPQAYQPAAYSSAPTGSPIHTGINLLELSWARTRVTWAWVLIGAIGCLSVGGYWVITRHPDFVAGLLLGFLLDPQKVSSESSRTALDILQVIAYFILSWVPLTGWALRGLLSQPKGTVDLLTQAADITPLLYQGFLYILLAVLIWRRSLVALGIATLLFLADSGVYTFGVFKLFQQLWDLNQKYQDLIQQYPSLATGDNIYDIGRWPWGLVVPIVVRLAILWALLLSFSGMGIVRLHHRRLKEARLQAKAQAA
jgi:hypothetical protein